MSVSVNTPKLGYSIGEAMAATSLGRTKIYALLSDPDSPLTAVKIGGRTIVTAESIEKLLSGEGVTRAL